MFAFYLKLTIWDRLPSLLRTTPCSRLFILRLGMDDKNATKLNELIQAG